MSENEDTSRIDAGNMGGTKNRWRAALREPLLQFFTLGLVVVIAHWLLGSTPMEMDHHIELPAELAKAASSDFFKQTGRIPTRGELEENLRQMAVGEALYREGLRWGLDRGDPIVRRRVIQKMNFILEDSARVPSPSPEDLRAFYDENLPLFTRPRLTSLEQRFFASSGQMEAAEQKAKDALARLAKNKEIAGDSFLWGDILEKQSDVRLDEVFGPGASEQIAPLNGNGWQGPVRSSYGYHLVRIISRQEPEVVSFEEARDHVYTKYFESKRSEAEKQARDELLDKYEISIDLPELQVAEAGK